MTPMSTNRVVIDAPANTIRGPWEEQPLRAALPVPQTDPRLELSENALVVASQNAYPIVAQQKTRRDSLGLAAGGAIALVLGCATFISLNSGRHPAATATAVTAPAAQTAQNLPIPAPMPGRPIAAPVPGMAAGS